MIRSKFIAVALFSFCTSLLAQGQYREQILTNMDGQGAVGAATPHPYPITHMFSSANPSASATGRIEFSSTPAPLVSVSVLNVNAAGQSLAGILEYGFSYSGQANAFIPIRFVSFFDLLTARIGNLARAEFNVGAGYGSSGQFIAAQILCQMTPACSPSTSTGGTTGDFSSVQANIFSAPSPLGEPGSSARGTITGTIMAPTDASGHGNGYVRMGAFAQSGGGISRAFIDPVFEIDQTYLLEDPSAALRIMDGVGNESGLFASPVPEPGSIGMMLAGLICLQLVRRGRQTGLRGKHAKTTLLGS